MNLLKKATGIMIPKHKYLTDTLPIKEAEVPKELIFPMAMHIGKPAEPVVKVGDYVKAGTLIAKSSANISSNIHSSVSGTVIGIEEGESFRGKCPCIIIENDYKYIQEYLEPLSSDFNIEDFIKRIEQAGVTGQGGAGFPTHGKINNDKDNYKYLVINGAECEPYSTTDHRVMVEHTKEIFQCIVKIHNLFEMEKTYIAIEENKLDAIKSFEREVLRNDIPEIKVFKVESRYPQGHSGILINNILKVEVPDKKNSLHIGVFSTNVSTIKAIYDAVYKGKVLTERVVTVTGPVIKTPQNLRIKIGTPVKEIVDQCGGFIYSPAKMINGGPMMGRPFSNMKIPVVKDTTTLLFLSEQSDDAKIEDCIRCGKCVDVCPMYLQPILIYNAFSDNRIDLCKDLLAGSCIECGCCSYICPSKIPLLEKIRRAKATIKKEERGRK